MTRKAKIFMNNRSQAIRIPKEFAFSVPEVLLRKQGDSLVISPRPRSWAEYLHMGATASDDFMETVCDLPVQERK